ncbi:hypothetical protein BGX20_005699, partial [Mortierella sp. AD010]
MLTLQTCAATTTGTSIPPGGCLDGHSTQVSSFSSSSSSSQHYSHNNAPTRHSSCHQYNNNNNNTATTNTNTSNNSDSKDSKISAVSAWNSATSSIVQQQRQNRKRSHEDIGSSLHHLSATRLEQSESTLTAGTGEASLQCPRLQAQQLCLPRKRSQSIGTSLQQGCGGVTSQCQLDPNAVKANFVDCLV